METSIAHIDHQGRRLSCSANAEASNTTSGAKPSQCTNRACAQGMPAAWQPDITKSARMMNGFNLACNMVALRRQNRPHASQEINRTSRRDLTEKIPPSRVLQVASLLEGC